MTTRALIGVQPSLIIHAPDCPRPAPLLRLTWSGKPEVQCPHCGATNQPTQEAS